MADDTNILPADQNTIRAAGFESSSTPGLVMAGQIDEITGRILVDSASGSGTVTSVSVVTANGFAGTVATATTTPAITLTTSITGILKGNGTAISAVTVGSGLSFDGTTLSATGGSGITIGTTTITSGTNTRILYNNAGVVGEYTLTGTGTVVVMANTPTLITPVLGVATATSINGLTITSSTGTVTITNAKTLAVTNTLTLSGTDSTTMTFPTTTATIARTDAGQTFTGVQVMTSPSITTANLSGTQLLAEGASIGLDPSGSADGAYSGITMTATAGYTQAFGDLVYLSSADSRWEAADADAASTGDRLLAMVVIPGTDGNACTLLMSGTIRADAKFPALTVGSAVYVGEAAGEIQVAIPTGADNVIRRVGYALTADSIYFNPSMDSQISVA